MSDKTDSRALIIPSTLLARFRNSVEEKVVECLLNEIEFIV